MWNGMPEGQVTEWQLLPMASPSQTFVGFLFFLFRQSFCPFLASLLLLPSLVFPTFLVTDVRIYVFVCIFWLLTSLELFSPSFVVVCDSFSLLLNLPNHSACWPLLVLRQMWPPPAWWH